MQRPHVVEIGVRFPFTGVLKDQTRENICKIAGARARQWFEDRHIIRPLYADKSVLTRVDIVRLIAPREFKDEALLCLDEIARYVHGSFDELFARSEQGDARISLFLKQA